MPNGVAPPGYRAQLLGSATSFDELSFFEPLEEGTPESSLILMELDFAGFPESENLESVNQALLDNGVPPWPGNSHIVFADTTRPVVYLAWVKGVAWLPVIGGMLALTVLPALLGILIWWLIPEELKDLIMMVVMMGFMFLIFQFITPMLSPPKEERRVVRRAE